ncbi:MAG: hypothetical protein SOZ89_06695, partial [Peptoniphilaceae bacterium]|nr:hypothetical protein [Peptoniphilaceae bacterium]
MASIIISFIAATSSPALPSRVKGMINILMIFDLKIKLYYIIESLYYAISSDSIFSVKLASLL